MFDADRDRSPRRRLVAGPERELGRDNEPGDVTGRQTVRDGRPQPAAEIVQPPTSGLRACRRQSSAAEAFAGSRQLCSVIAPLEIVAANMT